MNKYLSLVKFSHTIFALPFALVGYFIGLASTHHSLDMMLLLKVILCMVFARNAAMAFNRYLDRDIDSENERTVTREIPAGKITPAQALLFVMLNVILFIIVTYYINPLAFYLSPIALLVVLGYSFTKRFTSLCHFVLGIGLSLAPIGAYISVTGHFALIPVLYGIAVLFWVSGFDIIYALQDEDFDNAHGLHSIPVVLGRTRALMFSNLLHICTALIILYSGYLMSQQFVELQYLHWIGAAVFIALLVYQHSLVKPNDLSNINLAFFTTNGLASLVFGVMLILDFLT